MHWVWRVHQMPIANCFNVLSLLTLGLTFIYTEHHGILPYILYMRDLSIDTHIKMQYPVSCFVFLKVFVTTVATRHQVSISFSGRLRPFFFMGSTAERASLRFLHLMSLSPWARFWLMSSAIAGMTHLLNPSFETSDTLRSRWLTFLISPPKPAA